MTASPEIATDTFDDPFAPFDPDTPVILSAPAPAITAGPISTGKNGTDVPPLTVEMPEDSEEGRFYVIHPDLREGAYPRLNDLIADYKAFASITTIQGVYDKPTVSKWKIRLTAESATERMKSLHIATAQDRQALLDEWCRPVRTAYGRRITWIEDDLQATALSASLAAAQRGTDAHAIVEAISKGENPDVPDHLKGYVTAYRKFLKDFPDIEYVYVEATLLNRELRTMGTTDAIVRIGNRLGVLDYKTNKTGTVYPTTGMQLAAAATADAIVYYDGQQEQMLPIDFGLGVGLSPKGNYGAFHFDVSRESDNYRLFKNASEAFYAMRALPKQSQKVTRAFFN